jgi:5-methyltetrahydrofolate--homocysteine methyltransferase
LQESFVKASFPLFRNLPLSRKTTAAILDVNMGLSGIDEKEMMLKSVKVLAKMSSLPLCIDSTNPEVVEAALRIYPGRALVNSISGKG